MGKDSLRLNDAAIGAIRVEKYKQTRYWAVWIDNRLLAVTVYKKGALAIKELVVLASGVRVS